MDPFLHYMLMISRGVYPPFTIFLSWWFPHKYPIISKYLKWSVVYHMGFICHLRFRCDKKFILCWPILYCMVTGHLIQGLLYCSVLVLYVLSHLAVEVFHVHLLDLTLIDRRTNLEFYWTACFEIITQSFQNNMLGCVTLKSETYIELTSFQVQENSI